jgi:hypothetical protein
MTQMVKELQIELPDEIYDDLVHLAQIVKQQSEHDELPEWVGGSFDPEAFNLDEINDAVKKVR